MNPQDIIKGNLQDAVDLVGASYYYNLYATLISNAPKLSYNLVTNITLEDYGDYYKITISGPTESGYDYAQYLNEKTTPTKTTRNRGRIWYKWVEETIDTTARAVGGSIKYEL
jgi:hypothetical protein